MHSLRKTISFEFMEICLFEIHRPQLAVSGFIVTFSGTSPVEADIFCILFVISATVRSFMNLCNDSWQWSDSRIPLG